MYEWFFVLMAIKQLPMKTEQEAGFPNRSCLFFTAYWVSHKFFFAHTYTRKKHGDGLIYMSAKKMIFCIVWQTTHLTLIDFFVPVTIKLMRKLFDKWFTKKDLPILYYEI